MNAGICPECGNEVREGMLRRIPYSAAVRSFYRKGAVLTGFVIVIATIIAVVRSQYWIRWLPSQWLVDYVVAKSNHIDEGEFSIQYDTNDKLCRRLKELCRRWRNGLLEPEIWKQMCQIGVRAQGACFVRLEDSVKVAVRMNYLLSYLSGDSGWRCEFKDIYVSAADGSRHDIRNRGIEESGGLARSFSMVCDVPPGLNPEKVGFEFVTIDLATRARHDWSFELPIEPAK
ncbi:MAG: hypothetical protein HZB38_04985 [Planctomycetes bacterium]|nr:hypothetical protein [Planctomycetota bacterium]